AGQGLWSDPAFLADVAPNLNPLMTKTQFADFHGHGWVYRAVYKHDRTGKLLDVSGNPVCDVTPGKLAAAHDVALREKDLYKLFDPSQRPGYEVGELLAAEQRLINE